MQQKEMYLDALYFKPGEKIETKADTEHVEKDRPLERLSERDLGNRQLGFIFGFMGGFVVALSVGSL